MSTDWGKHHPPHRECPGLQDERENGDISPRGNTHREPRGLPRSVLRRTPRTSRGATATGSTGSPCGEASTALRRGRGATGRPVRCVWVTSPNEAAASCKAGRTGPAGASSRRGRCPQGGCRSVQRRPGNAAPRQEPRTERQCHHGAPIHGPGPPGLPRQSLRHEAGTGRRRPGAGREGPCARKGLATGPSSPGLGSKVSAPCPAPRALPTASRWVPGSPPALPPRPMAQCRPGPALCRGCPWPLSLPKLCTVSITVPASR